MSRTQYAGVVLCSGLRPVSGTRSAAVMCTDNIADVTNTLPMANKFYSNMSDKL